jgi:hypothetical protein
VQAAWGCIGWMRRRSEHLHCTVVISAAPTRPQCVGAVLGCSARCACRLSAAPAARLVEQQSGAAEALLPVRLLVLQVLTKLQVAKAAVHSYPFYPDALGIANIIAVQLDKVDEPAVDVP